MRPLKKGYMISTFPGGNQLSLLDKFQMLKDAGFAGVELRGMTDRDEVLMAVEKTGLKIPSIAAGPYTRGFSSANPSERGRGVESLKQVLRSAGEFGASSVLVVPGHVDERTSYAENDQRTRESILQAVPLAEDLGVVMAIENVWNNFHLSPLEAARYVDEFKSRAVGWHFDIGNVVNIGWPEQWIRILGRRIQKLHLKEFSRTKAKDDGMRKGFQVDLLEGDVAWPAVMKAIDDIGYDGWAIGEIAWHPPGVAPATRLKQLSEKFDQILAL